MRSRLDQHLVASGLTETRARARDLIKRGDVTVDGVVVTKAAKMVDLERDIAVRALANRYVARSGEKLSAALAHFGLSVSGRVALDVGASTGGFTQVLLENGAKYVYALDVGRGQLHHSLQNDDRVRDMAETDARNLKPDDLTHPITAITADVSFISLTKALCVPMHLAQPGCWLVALIKPQFELGPDVVPRDGIVKDETARLKALNDVSAFLAAAGWRVEAPLSSPITGKQGNVEYLVAAHNQST